MESRSLCDGCDLDTYTQGQTEGATRVTLTLQEITDKARVVI